MVNIKYCGNCNPDVNPKDVKKALETLSADIPRKNISIMVNGCSRACLTKRKPVDEKTEDVIIMSSKEVLRRKQ